MSSRSWPSIPRLVAVVAIVVALVLAFNLGQQATLVAQLQREKARLEQAVAGEEAELIALEARKSYVQTDEFVEEWARTIAKLTQPGEIRVVLIPKEGQPITPVQPVSGTWSTDQDKMPPYWQQWWALFFGPVAEYGLD